MEDFQAKDRFETLILKYQQFSSKGTIQKFVFLLDPKEKLLCKGLIAWKNIQVKLDFSQPKNIEKQLDYIWQFSRFDLKAFCAILQIQQNDALKLINRLKNLNLIFPDGTVNTQAYAVLLKYTQIELQKRAGLNKQKKDLREEK